MIRNALMRFMYGRYGQDQLNLFLLVSYLVLYCIFLFTRFVPLYWVSLALLAWTLFRLLSRNAPRRRAENAKFLKLIGPLQRWFHLRRTIYRDKELQTIQVTLDESNVQRSQDMDALQKSFQESQQQQQQQQQQPSYNWGWPFGW